MDSKWTIEEVNARLKAGKIKMGVAVCQRGDKLSLRATFPPKSGTGKPHQQYLALGCYANPAGLQFAEAEAKKVGGLLAQGRFEWSEYLDQGLQPAPISSAKNWIQKFEVDYYSRRGKSPTTETT